MKKLEGIFKYGNYGWLGEYRANTILSAIHKIKPDAQVEPVVPLDIFHACYLLNTRLVETPNPFLKEITEPIVKDEELRKITFQSLFGF